MKIDKIMDKYYKKLPKQNTCYYSLPLLVAEFNKTTENDIISKNIKITGQQKAYSKIHGNGNYSVKHFEKHISRIIEKL